MRNAAHRTRRRPRFDGQEQRVPAVGLFATCTAKELEWIELLTYELHVDVGHVLAHEQHAAEQVFFIVAGRAGATIGGAPVATLDAGCCIGGTAALARGCHPATVTADTAMVVRVASRVQYRALVAAIPSLAAPDARDPSIASDLADVAVDDQRVDGLRAVASGRV